MTSSEANLLELKTAVEAVVDREAPNLLELSHTIHAGPELAFKEYEASRRLTDLLEESGFRVDRGICDLETAFRATYGEGKPAVAIIAEYDALPEIGHACGHNVIAAAACGAALALKEVEAGDRGTIVVMGTPAEEAGGGKAIMAKRGGFDGLDAAMMIHPGVRDTVMTWTLACCSLNVEYFGKEAHASARPEDGINALDALIQAFNGINALRQHIREKARIHGVILEGGAASNIVPAYAKGSFMVRAEDDDYLDELKRRVVGCLEGAAAATGARLEYQFDEYPYSPLRSNSPMAAAFADNLARLGRTAHPPNMARGAGSTDMGNVSALMPAIHPSLAIAPLGVSAHSPEFAKHAGGSGGDTGVVVGAKCIATTVLDLFHDPELLIRAREDFLSNGDEL